MEIIKNEVRPVGYATLELSESEIITIIQSFEENCLIRQIPYSEMKGKRAEIYKALCSIIEAK